jgi:hypothetical protein
MKSSPNPAIVLCLCASLFLQSVGCSSNDSCIKYRVAGGAPHEYYVTYDSIQCIGIGKGVILSLKDSSVVQGKYWGIDVRPQPVYVVLPEYLSQVEDTLKDWVPVPGEQIIVYNYPSNSIVFEGHTDDDVWHGMMRAARQKLHYMTPQLVVAPKTTARIDQGSSTVNVPVDSISQVVRRQTVKPDPPAGYLGGAIAFVVVVVAAGIVLALTSWRGWSG